MRSFPALFVLSFLFVGCSSSAESPPNTSGDSAAAEDTGAPAEDTGTVIDDTLAASETGPSTDSGASTDTGSTIEDTGAAAKDTGTPTDTGTPDTGKPLCTTATCPAFAGSYAGPYSMYTAEKLGTTIINEVKCTGTNAIVIDLSKSPALTGTVTCTYSGSLSAFDKTESGTVSGAVFPDGTITGTLTHKFSSTMSPTFSFKGTLAAGKITVAGTSSWKPNPASAVPWEVTFSFTSNKI